MLTERLFKLFLLWTVQCEKEQCVRVCFRANYLFTVLEMHNHRLRAWHTGLILIVVHKLSIPASERLVCIPESCACTHKGCVFVSIRILPLHFGPPTWFARLCRPVGPLFSDRVFPVRKPKLHRQIA